ncbi:PREDICTED: uncharacterized protein LOC108972693 [Bactrocera latifrons]|uniref:uncharacterized protein LOC108972693 n=1 Tax=Bactrocera latifrons TaxID=174628 RepID=UPI0008DC6422|nr:PREDICTED: uncharacterized protein LOC108972693 [Bactrocera latifrons]
MSTNKSFDKSGKPTLGYTLFVHLSELKYRKKHISVVPCLPLIKSKLLVTDTLISRTKEQENFTDLETLQQEQIFRQRLRLSMLRILRQCRLGLSYEKHVMVKTTETPTKRSRDDEREELDVKLQEAEVKITATKRRREDVKEERDVKLEKPEDAPLNQRKRSRRALVFN